MAADHQGVPYNITGTPWGTGHAPWGMTRLIYLRFNNLIIKLII